MWLHSISGSSEHDKTISEDNRPLRCRHTHLELSGCCLQPYSRRRFGWLGVSQLKYVSHPKHKARMKPHRLIDTTSKDPCETSDVMFICSLLSLSSYLDCSTIAESKASVPEICALFRVILDFLIYSSGLSLLLLLLLLTIYVFLYFFTITAYFRYTERLLRIQVHFTLPLG